MTAICTHYLLYALQIKVDDVNTSSAAKPFQDFIEDSGVYSGASRGTVTHTLLEMPSIGTGDTSLSPVGVAGLQTDNFERDVLGTAHDRSPDSAHGVDGSGGRN